VQSFSWGSHPMEILAIVDDQGTEPVVRINLETWTGIKEPSLTATSVPVPIPAVITGGVQSALVVNPKTGKMVFTRHNAAAPAAGRGWPMSTHPTAPLLFQLGLPKLEGFSFKGADGDEVHGWLLRPPGFDASKKYPVVFLIHGGPQGAWHDEWHNRWNYQMFA